MNSLAKNAAVHLASSAPKLWLSVVITLIFAGFGRLVRGVTNSGAIAGAIVCFLLLIGAGWAGFVSLSVVFVLTWVATRFGYARKQVLGTAEPRTGRTAAQVFANLGVAAGCAALLATSSRVPLTFALGAALCEAAADTVSSEIGQAAGGVPRLITSGRKVKPGANGAITLAGSAAGTAAAIIVATVYELFGRHGWRGIAVCAGAGIAGTIADSILGATIERRGLAGNNLVNFISTLIAAAIALVLV